MSKANKFAKFGKNDKAFTGLEAAIVLIAFVVVAAVFSYVMLGAGFFTSQKAKEVVHTGVDMATSSIELAGPVYASGGSDVMTGIMIPVQLTAGGNPIDISKLTISYDTDTIHDANVFDTTNAKVDWIVSRNGDSGTALTGLLDPTEKIELQITLPDEDQVPVNTPVHIVISPANGGASLPIDFVVPAAISSNMQLTY